MKINSWVLVGIILVLVVLLSLLNIPLQSKDADPTDAQLKSCQTDADCIPLPSECHPRSCINKQYEGNYEKPEVCTELYDYQAAYSPEDCLCQNNVCVNQNLGRETQ